MRIISGPIHCHALLHYEMEHMTYYYPQVVHLIHLL